MRANPGLASVAGCWGTKLWFVMLAAFALEPFREDDFPLLEGLVSPRCVINMDGLSCPSYILVVALASADRSVNDVDVEAVVCAALPRALSPASLPPPPPLAPSPVAVSSMYCQVPCVSCGCVRGAVSGGRGCGVMGSCDARSCASYQGFC